MFYRDADVDTYGDPNDFVSDFTSPPGYVDNDLDCDDTDSDINPDGYDVCDDGIDQDCSGSDLVCQVLFQKTYGTVILNSGIGFSGRATQQTPDGGYIMLGEYHWYSNNYFRDFYVVKTDQYGHEEWSFLYDTGTDDYPHSLDLTSDGGYVLYGNTGTSASGFADCRALSTGG